MKIKNKWPSYTTAEIESAVSILNSNKVNYWSGEHGKAFEKDFSKHFNVGFSIALSNGTVALDLALRSLDIGPGDDVVVTPRTFIASVACIVNLGANPIFADVDLDSGNITASSIEKVLTPKTKAIICVHLAGWPCDMDPILSLAHSKNIFVVEDCAQAHNAKYKDKYVGTLGDIAAWSFCEDKIMTTAGEGGMVTTNNEELFNRAWAFKDHGKNFEIIQKKSSSFVFKYVHSTFGSNYRMTEIQSAIGRIQLTNLDEWTEARKRNAMKFNEVLKNYSDIARAPLPSEEFSHAYYKYYVYLKTDKIKKSWSRERVVNSLNEIGLPCGSGACPEVYMEDAYKHISKNPHTRLPNAKKLGEESLMLLVHPTLTDEEIDFSCQSLSKVLNQAKNI